MGRVLKTEAAKLIDWFCPACGERVSADDGTCPHCKVKFSPITSVAEEEKRIQEVRDQIEQEVQEVAPPEKKKKRKPVEEAPPTPPEEKNAYVPREGSRKETVFNMIQGDGAMLEEIGQALIEKHGAKPDKIKQVVRTCISEFIKSRNLNIVKVGDTYQLQ